MYWLSLVWLWAFLQMLLLVLYPFIEGISYKIACRESLVDSWDYNQLYEDVALP